MAVPILSKMSHGIYYFKKNFCSYNLHKLLQDIWTLGHFHYGFFRLCEAEFVMWLLSYFNMMILLLFTLILTYLQLMKQD